MDYSALIDKIMPLVEDYSPVPFIISRDNGKWKLDHLALSPEDATDHLAAVRERDPYAIQLTGEYFSRGSMPFVYDNILRLRLCAEFDAAYVNKDGALHALLAFMEENIGEFSQDVTEHLTNLDRPLAMLYRMDLPDLYSYTSEYDKDNAQEAINAIENRVAELRSRKNEEVMRDIRDIPEKRVIEGYTEKYCMEFAGKEVFIGENPSAEQPYFICNIKYDNLLGMEERYDGIISDDYVEIMREFVNRVDTLTTQLEAERRESGLPVQVMTHKDCLPNSQNVDWIGKTLIIKPEILAPEFRSAESQYVLCKSGFGARPNSRGSKVYVKELFSGKECYYRSHQIAGIADPAKIPEWAARKLAELSPAQEQRAAEPPTKQSLPKKPTLHDKLEKAKQKQEAANNRDKRGDKPKKRDDKEV